MTAHSYMRNQAELETLNAIISEGHDVKPDLIDGQCAGFTLTVWGASCTEPAFRHTFGTFYDLAHIYYKHFA